MIRVVGKLPKSIDVSGINLDRVLVLMFDGSPLDVDIHGVDPRITYIITNRRREQMAEYLDEGFYCVAFGVEYADLTYDMIYEFLLTDYELNSQMYKSSRLHDLYKNKLSLFDAIMTILVSIRNRDAASLTSAVKYNLEDAISGLNDIRNIIEFSQDMTGIQGKFQALEAKVKELTENAKTANPEAMEMAQASIQQLQSALDKKQQEIDILTSDNKDLSDKVNSLQAAGSDVVPASKFNQLMADKQLVDQQLAVARTEKASLEQRLAAVDKVAAVSTPTDAFGQAALIESLKQELELTKKVSPAEKVMGMLPIITDQLALKTPYVLQLKEIKPAVYMNSLIRWTVLMLKSGFVRSKGKAPLILVFDNLMDQFRINKYQKHGFAINSVPNPPNFVVVTNDLSILFLKEVLKIQKYDFVMVIDRLGALRSVANSDKTLTYYLIDSPEDISDFSLDPQACIGFYKNDGSCKYFTEPSPDTALIKGDRRVSRVGQNGWITEILRGLQIIEND